jgi:hypothetical protein
MDRSELLEGDNEYLATRKRLLRFLTHTKVGGYAFLTAKDEKIIPILNHWLIAETQKASVRVTILFLRDTPEKGVLQQIHEACKNAEALIIPNIHDLLPGLRGETRQKAKDFLFELNLERETILELDTPILFWVASMDRELILRGAPDLYSMRSMNHFELEIMIPEKIKVNELVRELSIWDRELFSSLLDPKDPDIVLLEGYLNDEGGNPQNLERTAAQIMVPLAFAYSKAGMIDEAANLLDRAIPHLSRKERESNFIVAKTMLRIGRKDDCKEKLKQVASWLTKKSTVELSLRARVFALLTVLHFLEQNEEQTIGFFNRYLQAIINLKKVNSTNLVWLFRYNMAVVDAFHIFQFFGNNKLAQEYSVKAMSLLNKEITQSNSGSRLSLTNAQFGLLLAMANVNTHLGKRQESLEMYMILLEDIEYHSSQGTKFGRDYPQILYRLAKVFKDSEDEINYHKFLEKAFITAKNIDQSIAENPVFNLESKDAILKIYAEKLNALIPNTSPDNGIVTYILEKLNNYLIAVNSSSSYYIHQDFPFNDVFESLLMFHISRNDAEAVKAIISRIEEEIDYYVGHLYSSLEYYTLAVFYHLLFAAFRFLGEGEKAEMMQANATEYHKTASELLQFEYLPD